MRVDKLKQNKKNYFLVGVRAAAALSVSPGSRCLSCLPCRRAQPLLLAEPASGSVAAKQAQTDAGRLPAVSAVCWARAARLVWPPAPNVQLLHVAAAGAEECPSSFVIEAMGEPDV